MATIQFNQDYSAHKILVRALESPRQQAVLFLVTKNYFPSFNGYYY